MRTMKLEITATGDKNIASENSEVILLGVFDGIKTRDIQDVHGGNSEWTLNHEVYCGPSFNAFGPALMSTAGSITCSASIAPKLLFLCHPWSGVVQVSLGENEIIQDLYSKSTEVCMLDVETGNFAQLSQRQFEEIRFSLSEERQSNPANGVVTHLADEAVRPKDLPDSTLEIVATGRKSHESEADEVIVVNFKPFGESDPIDLARTVGSEECWELVSEAYGDGLVFRNCVKSRSGSIQTACDADGYIQFLKHKWSGIVQINYGKVSIEIDLYEETPTLFTLPLKRLLSFSNPLATSKMRQRLLTEKYAALSATFNLDQPVALYVPRWRGVAASSCALFSQSLPVPIGLATHPGDLTEADIVDLANALLATGCRHFVISGGDLFNLELIKHVHKMNPRVRFDQLWHSSFLQMGEPHDWNLLRHWIDALSQGYVTRIGVVKEGLQDWFSAFDIEAVFIPNVVSMDYDQIQVTDNEDTVGIWLSGSSAYRKLPHATILGLKLIPDIRLRASGLDAQSVSMIRSLKIQYLTASSEPIPHQQLIQEIGKTGLSVYNTISECSPMLPLESFSLGVPCLVGPASHLFRRDDYLYEHLVVKKSQDPQEIARKIQYGLKHRAELLEGFIDYHKEEEILARQGVARLTA